MSKLPNIDRIREHQANERTFLAWLRTSIALIGFGFAIARFSLFLRQFQASVTATQETPQNHFSSQSLGFSLVVIGITTLALGAWRYNRVFLQIEREEYQTNRLIVWFIAWIVMILGVLSIPLVLWPNQVQNPPSSTPNQRQSQKPLVQRKTKQ